MLRAGNILGDLSTFLHAIGDQLDREEATLQREARIHALRNPNLGISSLMCGGCAARADTRVQRCRSPWYSRGCSLYFQR